MQIPLIIYAASYAYALPAAVAVVRRVRSTAALWIAGALFFGFCTDRVAFYMAFHHINNHWLSYIDIPIMGALCLVGLSYWQISYVERLALRITVILYCLAWTAMVAWLEDLSGFSRFAAPMHALVLMGAAVWTMARRGTQATDHPLLQEDWFWICGGLAFYGATSAAWEPVAAYLMGRDVALVKTISELRLWFILTALLGITWGYICSNRLAPSGHSSSPAP